MVLSDHLQNINSTVIHNLLEKFRNDFLSTPECAHTGLLTCAEVRYCMSRAPASASGRGEPPSDEAGRSNSGAAAGSSASRMRWSTPWWDAHMTSACHSTGCSVGVRRTSKKPDATLRNTRSGIYNGERDLSETPTFTKHRGRKAT